MKTGNQIRRILSKWFFCENPFLHRLSVLMIKSACFTYKLGKYPSEQEIGQIIERFASTYPQDRKDEFSKDIRRCWMRYGLAPDEYFMYHIHERDKKERAAFISDIDRLAIASLLNDRTEAKLLVHKYQTYQKYKEFYQREMILGKQIDPSFIERHPRFIVKEENGKRGINIAIEDVSAYASKDELIIKIKNKDNIVCEELIEQNEIMKTLHPQSINTIRVRVLRTMDGDVVIWNCTLRTGRGDSIVDNAYMGGPSALIDSENGTVISNGHTESGLVFEKHPDSQIVFKGFRIPEWNELKKLVAALMEKGNTLGYVGWDLALSTKGWVVVEGNSFGQVVTPQLVLQKPLKEELWNIIYGKDADNCCRL